MYACGCAPACKPPGGEPARATPRLCCAMVRQARVALQYLPWWSFSEGYAPLRDAVGLAGGPSDVRRALSQQDQIGSVLSGSFADKTDKHVRLQDAWHVRYWGWMGHPSHQHRPGHASIARALVPPCNLWRSCTSKRRGG